MLHDADARSRLGWIVLRVALAGLIAAHGWARLLAGAVTPFGEWLTTQGVPFGHAIAAGVTAIEILGTPLLALGRWAFPLTIAYAAIYALGIALVHARAGWFVVGLGRNGAEFSVLLIVTLLCVGLQHAKPRAAREAMLASPSSR
jgi:putative oxidoreductase